MVVYLQMSFLVLYERFRFFHFFSECWFFGQFNHSALPKVHERSQEMDFVLLVLRKLLCSNSPYVKVSAS